MKFLSILLSVLLVLTLSFGASSAVVEDPDVGGEVLFSDGSWTYEKLEVYGYRIRNTLLDDSVLSVPYSFSKQDVTEIAPHAFSGINNVEIVNTTYRIATIGDYALSNCRSLSEVKLYSGLTELGVGCFYGDSSLTTVNLDVTSISLLPAYCFADCGISEAILPETCTAIDPFAFLNCYTLKRIYIPAGVTEIAGNAFNGCDDLVIYADEGSYAFEYAIAKGIDYVITNPDYYEVEILLGDADGDNDVSILDATRIQRWLASYNDGNEEQVLLCGDTDRDGDVSILDATMIQRWLAQFTVPTPIGEVITIQVPVTE